MHEKKTDKNFFGFQIPRLEAMRADDVVERDTG